MSKYDTEVHFRHLAGILWRRWRLIMTIGLSGAALAGLLGLVLPPKFTAKAQIVFEPQRFRPAAGAHVDEAAIETQVTMLTSRSHLQRVLESFHADPESVLEAPQAQTGPDANVGNGWKESGARLLVQSATASVAKDALSETAGSEEAAASLAVGIAALNFDELDRRLNAYQERRSRVIAVTFNSASPEIAAAVANRAAKLYVEAEAERSRADRKIDLARLDERVAEFRKQAEQADLAVQKYRVTHGLGESNRTDSIDQQVADLNRQVAVAKSDLAGKQARLASLRDLPRRGPDIGLLIEALDNPGLTELYRNEKTLLQTQAKLTETLPETDPKILSVSAQRQELQQTIRRNVEQILGQLTNETQALGTRVRSLQQRLATLQAVSNEAREPEIHLRELEREATVSAQLYNSVLQRQKEMREQGDVPPDVRVLSPARVPDEPSSPNPILFIFPALVIASIGGSLLALLLERLDRGLRSEHDVNDALAISCIGLVPQLYRLRRLRPHQYLVQKPFAAYTESIRSVVAAALQLTNPHHAPKVFLVTSSVPGEGKTTLAVSFAVYAALLQRRVILVDLDFRHPAVSRELGGKAEKGILDVLKGRSSAEIIQRIPELELDYLPLPRNPVDPLAILASEQVPDLLRQLRESYDCVVIDSAPLLGTTEARLLASMVDKVLFAVKWGRTRREVAQNALSLLRYRGSREKDFESFASAVITQVDLKKHARFRYGDVGESFSRFSS
jgi:succinoglycan biosynthesis transport protein ExoP